MLYNISMPKEKEKSIHVHVWKPIDVHNGTDDDLDFDSDVVVTNIYDDHTQYSFEFEGRTIEIRVPTS